MNPNVSIKPLALPPPVVYSPKPFYSTLATLSSSSSTSSARSSQSQQPFIQLPPTPPPPPYSNNPQSTTSSSSASTSSNTDDAASPVEDPLVEPPSSFGSSDDSSKDNVNSPPVVEDGQSGVAGLRGLVKNAILAKTKTYQFEYDYADRDSFESEINEFYNYQDNPSIQEGKALFEQNFVGSWKEDAEQRIEYILVLLERLELSNPEDRLAAAKALLYISQGVFGETSTTAEQIKWIRINNQILLDLDALTQFRQALQVVSKTLDMIVHCAPNEVPPPTNPSATSAFTPHEMTSTEKQAAMDVANAETSIYLSLCYMMVEVNMEKEVLVVELSEKVPFAIDLFDFVARLAEGNRKHYPVKKLLLLLWKVLLATVGNEKVLKDLKGGRRAKEGLAPLKDDFYVKSTPQDFHTFNVLSTHKYPAYYTPDITTISPPDVNLAEGLSSVARRAFGAISATGAMLQPYTASKTNPTPDGNPSIERYMPTSLQESLNLMRKHMYVSAGSVQVARVRADLDKWENQPVGWNEIGGEKGSGERDLDDDADVTDVIQRVELLYQYLVPNMASYIGMLVRLLYYVNLGNTVAGQEGNGVANGGVNSAAAETERLENTYMTPEERQEFLDRIDVNRHKEVVTKAISAILIILGKATKRDHVLKFEYLSQLLVDNNCTILILKMLSTWFQNPATAANNAGAGGAELNSNNNFIGSWLKGKDDPDELNFFQFCRGRREPESSFLDDESNDKILGSLNAEENRRPPQEDDDEEEFKDAVHEHADAENATKDGSPISTRNNPTPAVTPQQQSAPVLKGSWRNFFSAINLLRILQMLTKRKIHRILSLVQWKASAVLKRVIKVNHTGLQIYALKLLKSQIPFMGRKWRSSNMKVITAIYLHLRPYLKEEYLAGDADIDVDEALSQEQHMRALIAFYHHSTFPEVFPSPTSMEAHLQHQNGNEQAGDGRPGLRGPYATPDHDELDMLLSMVRKSHESAVGGMHMGGQMVSHHDAMLLLPLGKNKYQAEEEILGLDENFMQNYELWLHQEVYSPEWKLNESAATDLMTTRRFDRHVLDEINQMVERDGGDDGYGSPYIRNGSVSTGWGVTTAGSMERGFDEWGMPSSGARDRDGMTPLPHDDSSDDIVPPIVRPWSPAGRSEGAKSGDSGYDSWGLPAVVDTSIMGPAAPPLTTTGLQERQMSQQQRFGGRGGETLSPLTLSEFDETAPESYQDGSFAPASSPVGSAPQSPQRAFEFARHLEEHGYTHSSHGHGHGHVGRR
ncbi:Factor arrest protein 11 [Blyttiomyces sp. JEL0837]|nr:Factor arrest protein 11 [Blyttiomyces sp. JEL0837]